MGAMLTKMAVFLRGNSVCCGTKNFKRIRISFYLHKELRGGAIWILSTQTFDGGDLAENDDFQIGKKGFAIQIFTRAIMQKMTIFK